MREKVKKLRLEKELNRKKEEAKLAEEELKERMKKNLEEEMNIRIKNKKK